MKQLNQKSIELANRARNQYYNELKNNNKSKRQVFVAASLPPLSETHRPDLIKHGL